MSNPYHLLRFWLISLPNSICTSSFVIYFFMISFTSWTFYGWTWPYIVFEHLLPLTVVINPWIFTNSVSLALNRHELFMIYKKSSLSRCCNSITPISTLEWLIQDWKMGSLERLYRDRNCLPFQNIWVHGFIKRSI